MSDGVALLTFEWSLSKLAVGVAAGYSLRVIEHFIWAISGRNQNPGQATLFAILILPQSVLFGAALGYVALVGIAYHVSNEITLGISAYAVSAVMAFIATDLRELLRRISRW